MRLLGKVGLAVAAVGVLTGGAAMWLQRQAEAEARQRFDAHLAQAGLAQAVRYGGLSVNPLSRDITVSDIVYAENGAEVWRIDRFALKDIKVTPKGLPGNLVVALRGIHLDFARWEKDCAATGASCEYLAGLGDLRAQGIDAMVADVDLAYAMDDAAKRMRLSAAMTMRDFFSIGFAFILGGLNGETLRDIVGWAKESTQAGVPPVLAAATFAATVGRSIERVEIGGLGFSMTDRGALRRRAEFLAKEEGGHRPPADILREQLTDMETEIRSGAQAWMDPAFVEAMVGALQPFAYSGQPYRITSGEAAPVVVLKRGAMGLEAGPDLADPVRLFRALALKVDNRPL